MKKFKWDDSGSKYTEQGEEIKIGNMFPRPSFLLTVILGFLERGCYTLCIYFGAPYFIPVWLAFKVVTRWTHNADSTPKSSKDSFLYESHRAVVYGNIYLIGTLISIIFGVVGGLICKYDFLLDEWIRLS